MTVLSDAPVGQVLRITAVNGGKELSRRLRSLGLTPGTEVKILQHRGRGVVVANEGNRVALGGAIADKLLGEVIE
jgi:ferrous iron transport protein A